MNGIIRPPQEQDVQRIIGWLKSEDSGFWHNREIITRAFDESRLTILCSPDDGSPIAFNVGGLQEPGIFAVKQTHWRKGYGRQLVRHLVANAVEEDVCGLHIYCEPSTSIPFWRAMGFEPVAKKTVGRPLEAFRLLPKSLVTRTTSPPERLTINIHYDDIPKKTIADKTLDAEFEDGQYFLKERFSIFLPDGGDRYVSIWAGERLLWDHKKLKYSRDIGFCQPRLASPFWFLDCLTF